MGRTANTLGRLIGYHGCDRQIAEDILNGHAEISSSNNEYDWLGAGAYFWIDSPVRALNWARYLYSQKKIEEPYVLGAFINSGLCLNLMDYGVIDEIKSAYDGLRDVLNIAEQKIPKNLGSKDGTFYHRNLDAAVFNYLHEVRKQSRLTAYDTVIGVFEEGNPVYKGACFHDKTHVQVAVRNPEAIIGYFRVKEGHSN